MKLTGSRRMMMRAIGAFGLGPAAHKAAAIQARLGQTFQAVKISNLDSAISGDFFGSGDDDRHVSRAEKRLGRTIFTQLTRARDEHEDEVDLRRTAWAMPLDPDLAGLRACSPVFLRHLQLKRLREEREERRKYEWRLWPPDWMRS